MSIPNSQPTATRRTAFAGIGAGGLGLALGSRRAVAQDTTADAMANHPIVGAWMVTTGAGPAMAVFHPDGTNLQGLPATQAGPDGSVAFVSTQVGMWEPVSERGVHFTGVQLHTDATGALIGTVEIDAYPVVSEDGQTLLDDDPRSGPIIRDAAGVVIADLRGTGGPPAMGLRMRVGASGLPTETPPLATPTS